jgi:fatty-acid desaturase
MTHNKLVRSLQIINHLSLVGGLVFVLVTGNYFYLLISLLTYWFIGVIGINIGMHRLLAHRSFITNRIIEIFCSLVSVVTTVGSPLAWIAVHRQHHKYCEKEGDPHSPYSLGNFKAWVGLWNLVRFDLRLIKDIRKDKLQRILHTRYLEIIILYCVFLALINPILIIFVYAIPACLCLHSTSTIIVIAHRHGYKTHDLKQDQSRNSWIANIITLGEGWHNNHHANQRKWSNWEKWWEWDLPACIIYLIKK